MRKKFVLIIVCICLFVSYIPVFTTAESNDDIVILYENDVHCQIDGYSKIAALKNEMSSVAGHVGVVSSGDYIQGGSIGSISQGEYIIELMNLVGYDAVTLGNHEFDYKLSRLNELVEKMDTKPVCANFQKIGESDSFFEPYKIVSYGTIDVAYIGVVTPDTLTSTAITQFTDENGNYIYTFHGNDLYETVQKSIDSAKADGADYIIALSHLGTEYVFEQWSSQKLVENTKGLDVVLDGHSHSTVESLMVKDKSGEDVVISSTGTKFANIGKLTISDGNLKTELIDTESYAATDNLLSDAIDKINNEYETLGHRKIGESKVNLKTIDENGNRIIRNMPSNMGDFCADAFRIVKNADVGFINGGAIRADIAAGDITFNDILSVLPWNNTMVTAEVTGQQLVDMLELGAVLFPGENGSFQHVSGMKFDLDKSVESSVIFDENMLFVGVSGERRVKNVKILDKVSGEYKDIGLEETYVLASHNHLLLDLGGGATMFKDAKILSDDGMLDVELLEIYITDYLGGVIGEEYKTHQGRINIVGAVSDETSGDPVIPDTDDTYAMEVLISIMCFSAFIMIANLVVGKKNNSKI